MTAAALMAAAPAQSQPGGFSADGQPASEPAAPVTAVKDSDPAALARQRLLVVRSGELRRLQRLYLRLTRELRRLSGRDGAPVRVADVSLMQDPRVVLNANRKLRVKVRALRVKLIYWTSGDGF